MFFFFLTSNKFIICVFFKLDTPPAPMTTENGSVWKCFSEKLTQRETEAHKLKACSMTLYWLNLINWRIKISKTINLGPNPATYFHRNNFIDFSHSTLKHKCYLAISNLIFLAIVPKSLFAKGFRIWIKPENSDGINQVEKWNLVGDTNIHFSNKLQKVWDEILRSILGTT